MERRYKTKKQCCWSCAFHKKGTKFEGCMYNKKNKQQLLQELNVSNPFYNTGNTTYNPQTEDYIKSMTNFNQKLTQKENPNVLTQCFDENELVTFSGDPETKKQLNL